MSAARSASPMHSRPIYYNFDRRMQMMITPNTLAPKSMPLVHRLREGPLPSWVGPQDYWDNWQDHDNMDKEITPQLGAVSDSGGSLDLYCSAPRFTQLSYSPRPGSDPG